MSDFPLIISNEFAEQYKNKIVPWGFNGLGYIVYKRTYARNLPNGQKEEWYQTIQRCINGAQKIGADYSQKEAELLFDLIFHLKCNFAGRMLWQLGTDTVDRFGANSLLNCWFCKMNEPQAFLFLFENLMLGGGVGFSIRREDIHELPKVKRDVSIKHLLSKDADYIVPDSRGGWISLLQKVFEAYYVTGKSFTYSTILVRGYGEPIRGFGGTASGPQILIEGIEKICKTFESREGKKLRSIDVLDICNIIGSIVVAGNVRRSAEIALGDPDDYLYLRAKNWSLGNIPNTRAMSNNTIYADSYEHISNEIWNNGFVLDEETGIAKGEPYGFFNLPLSQKYGRIKDGLMSKSDLYPQNNDSCEGTNPCVSPETLLLTKDGNKIISSLLDQEVEVWNGKQWSKTKVIKTGTNQKLIKVVLNDGTSLDCTEYHKFYVDTANWSMGNLGTGLYYKESDLIQVQAKDLQPGQKVRKPFYDFENKEIKYDLLCSVESVLDLNRYDDTYCVNEPLEHKAVFNGILTGNCGEISLSNYECCNLSELYLNNITSPEELFNCAKLLYKTQKAIAAMPFLHEETNQVVHKNMRLGLGVTGTCQSLEKIDWLDDCYVKLRHFDKSWSAKKGYPPSIKLTTQKPSGTLSLLGGSTPGVHPAYSHYYIRRVRMSSDDALVKECRIAGYYIEYAKNFDGSEDKKTVVVEFPCEAGEKALVANELSAIQQLELVKKIQSVWADNAVSVTVYYKLEELDGIKQWLKDNYAHAIKSVSFLLHSEHGFQQAPYEEISKDQYLKIKSKIKDLSHDIKDGEIETMECAGGACPIR